MVSDVIIVNELSIRAPLGASHWVKPNADAPPQPLFITVSVPLSIASAATSDSLPDSVNYSTLSKTIEALISQRSTAVPFPSLESLAEAACAEIFAKFTQLDEVHIRVEKARAHLHAKGVALELLQGRSRMARSTRFFVRDLELSTIIGINPWERLEKQRVKLNLSFDVDLSSGNGPELVSKPIFDYRGLIESVSSFVLASSYETVETLVTGVAQSALSCPSSYSNTGQHIVANLTASVAKPSAIMFASSAEVRITRSLEDFPSIPHFSPYIATAQGSLGIRSPRSSQFHVAALALGSNLGDRVMNIERALQALEDTGIRIIDTSFMYETEAMYVEDQPQFANAACLITTDRSPQALLSLLKEVESSVGRTPTFRNGPRVVDLDIILYDDEITSEAGESVPAEGHAAPLGRLPLTIPHKSMLEREFVLRPLADIIPNVLHPTTKTSIKSHLDALPKGPNPMRRILTFPSPRTHSGPIDPISWPLKKRTFIMATLNTTPDSFSDGGDYQAITDAVAYARDAISAGADMIDVGGYSTRPGAAFVSVEEEIKRVVPIIQALRREGIQCPISIDTFRAEVARRAISDAGANCINDVRALREEGMREVAKELGVPVIMMHSRGNEAGKNKDYGPRGVMAGVRDELTTEVVKAFDIGLRRWNIVVDPGIGFSKSVAGNLELVRDLRVFTAPSIIPPNPASVSTSLSLSTRSMSDPLAYLPVLVGSSRKTYLGALIDRPDAPPRERDYATTAVCAAAIQQGCDILRVHNVRITGDAIRVADALWRV